MSLSRVLYESVAAGQSPARDTFDIIEESARNNALRRVTGFLMNDGDRYLQYLEGPPIVIEDLMGIIAEDPRHHSLNVLARESGSDRLFADWSMKSLISFDGPPAIEELSVLLSGKHDDFDLAEQARAFLKRG